MGNSYPTFMKNSPKPKKILFDAGPLANGAKTGVGYYTYHLIDSLARNHPDWEFVGHYFNFLGRKKVELPEGPNITYRTSRIIPGKVLAICRRLGFQLPYELFIKSRGDVVIFPNFVTLPCIFPIKKIATIHDLGYVRYPEYVQKANASFLRRFVRRTVVDADLLLSVSQFTKNEIVDYYNVSPDKILVTPIPPVDTSIQSQRGELKLPNKYILFLGTLEPRKNYMALVEAYRALPENIKKQYGLALAGGLGWYGKDMQDQVRKYIAAGDNIVMTGYMTNEEREYTYEHATMFAHASHYEGFGMPVIEAMKHNLPVAVSDLLVFREVAGNAALYFDKDNVPSITKAMQELLTNESKRKQLQRNIPKQLAQFDWDKITETIGKRIETL